MLTNTIAGQRQQCYVLKKRVLQQQKELGRIPLVINWQKGKNLHQRSFTRDKNGNWREITPIPSPVPHPYQPHVSVEIPDDFLSC